MRMVTMTSALRSTTCPRSAGIVSSAAVAPTTPQLSEEEAERFDLSFARVRLMASEYVCDPWVTRVEGDGLGGSGDWL